MLPLDAFKVKVEVEAAKTSHHRHALDVTLEQLAANSGAQYMLEQATEIRTLCNNPLVYQGKPIVPRSVEVTIALFEKNLYIKNIKLDYMDSQTRTNHTTDMTYGDFIQIAASRKK